MRKFSIVTFIIVVLFGYCIASAIATGGMIVEQACADSGSAVVIPPPPADSTAQPAPVVSPLQQLKDLQAAYEALKSNKDKSARMLLWAAAIAAALKLLLSGINLLAGKKPKQWLALIALGLGVPIYLLSHFVAGHGWFDSILVAGAGPGAVFVHELIKFFTTKKPAEAK